MLTISERRARFRAIMEARQATLPASVFDPVSARLAEAAGFETAIVAGSTASYAILGAPDITLITLSELAEQVRRVTRASSLCVFVDADHGYGNALNVIRTVQEMEAAGACAVTIEDTSLPRAFGGKDGELISTAEFEGKLRAAVSAKVAPDFLVVGRTHALQRVGMEAALERIAICNETGVDAAFVAGVETEEQLREIAGATDLPFILPNLPAALNESPVLAECHVAIRSWDHVVFAMTVEALREAYDHVAAGKPASELRPRAATGAVMRVALGQDEWDDAARRFLA
jgi:carboxyvinyl-carboxyphosphonate phosphorylmutase